MRVGEDNILGKDRQIIVSDLTTMEGKKIKDLKSTEIQNNWEKQRAGENEEMEGNRYKISITYDNVLQTDIIISIRTIM